MKLDWSKRLKALPPYLFAEIDKQKQGLRARGIKFIDLSIGDPDILAPKRAVDALYRFAKTKDNQKYALDQGKKSFRVAIKKWFVRRFGVRLDEVSQILPLIGSKEGLVHFPLAFVNPGDYVIIPSPGYPGYRSAALFAGAKPYELALPAENGFLPRLDKIPLSVRNKARLIYLNYPNNPTTALASGKFLEGLVKFCSRYGIIIAYDNAYSEIYFNKKPLSILEVKGAMEVAVEFHSLSKTFCMTGFRVGFACGRQELIKGLLKVKGNVDSGIFGAIQDCGAYCLDKESAYVKELRRVIKDRRDFFIEGLQDMGFNNIFADSTFYVWVQLPGAARSSIDFTKRLIEKRVIATPGVGFGRYGEGFIRFALTVGKPELARVLKLLR